MTQNVPALFSRMQHHHSLTNSTSHPRKLETMETSSYDGTDSSEAGKRASKSKLLALLFAECRREMPELLGDWFSSSSVELSVLVDFRDRGGYTILWELLRKGSLTCADILLELGDKNMLLAKTNAGRSLLMAAVGFNQPESAIWLLRQWTTYFGLDRMQALLEEQTLAGYTALWWCGMDGRESVARVLLAYGADDLAVDRNRVSCKEIAQQRRENGVLALYVEAERAYFMSKVRRLAERGRAVGPEAGEDEQAEQGEEEVKGGGAAANQRRVETFAAFVMNELASDLVMELGLYMR